MGSQEWLWIFVFVQSFSFALDWFSEVAMNVSSEIAWGIIRDNSCFLLKKRGEFRTEQSQEFCKLSPPASFVRNWFGIPFHAQLCSGVKKPFSTEPCNLTNRNAMRYLHKYIRMQLHTNNKYNQQCPKVVTNDNFQVQWPRQRQGCRGRYKYLKLYIVVWIFL